MDHFYLHKRINPLAFTKQLDVRCDVEPNAFQCSKFSIEYHNFATHKWHTKCHNLISDNSINYECYNFCLYEAPTFISQGLGWTGKEKNKFKITGKKNSGSLFFFLFALPWCLWILFLMPNDMWEKYSQVDNRMELSPKQGNRLCSNQWEKVKKKVPCHLIRFFFRSLLCTCASYAIDCMWFSCSIRVAVKPSSSTMFVRTCWSKIGTS